MSKNWRPGLEVAWTWHDELDPVAVERAIDGDPPLRPRVFNGSRNAMTRAERQAAVARLDQDGLSASQIAARLRIADRTVHRMRARNRLEATECPK